MYFGLMNVMLLHNDHRHISLTIWPTFSMAGTSVQIYLFLCACFVDRAL
jgi:hypothetical protein